MKFSELHLHPLLEAAIEKSKFTECTPVQEATIPHVLNAKDVAGLAQTGTGKTAAFLLPLMDRVLRSQEAGLEKPKSGSGSEPEPKAGDVNQDFSARVFRDWHNRHFILILVPTRELAEQVYENINTLKGEAKLRAVSIYGGVSYDKQKSALKEGVEFIVATPGRLLDLYKEHLVDLKGVRAIVFDEADRMFDMGFKDDMKYILSRVPKERQFLVFSATLNLDVMNTAYQYGANPIDIDVSRDQAKAENVVDKIFHVGSNEKPQYLLSLLKKHNPKQTIIFSNFKMNVPRVSQFLNENGHPSVGISSLITQAQRNRVMSQFKSDNDQNILVATDVAARGLDIKGVDMIINFELPDDPENYVHRIGRTGRAGASGLAFSFVSDRDVDALKRVEDYLRHKVDVAWLEDAEILKDFKPMPSDRPQRSGPPPRSSGGREASGDRFTRRPFQGDRPPQRSDQRSDQRSNPRNNQQSDPRSDSKDRGEFRNERERGANSAQRPSPRGGPRSSQGPRDNRNDRNDQRPQSAQNTGGGSGGGRHSGPRNGPNSNARRPTAGQQRPAYQAGSARPPQNKNPKATVTKSAPSIGQKVTGFIKRLFS